MIETQYIKLSLSVFQLVKCLIKQMGIKFCLERIKAIDSSNRVW